MSIEDVSRVRRRALSGTTLAIVFCVANLRCGDDSNEHPPGPDVGDGDTTVVPERPIPQPVPDPPSNVAGTGASNDFGNGGTGIVTGTGGTGLSFAGSPFGGLGSNPFGGLGSNPFPGSAGSGLSAGGRIGF